VLLLEIPIPLPLVLVAQEQQGLILMAGLVDFHLLLVRLLLRIQAEQAPTRLKHTVEVTGPQ